MAGMWCWARSGSSANSGPGADEGFHAFDGFGQGDLAAPVQQIEVEVIGLEPLQAGLTGLLDAAARGVLRIDFADQEDLVAQARERVTQQSLGRAVAVHLGGVDQAHAELDASTRRSGLLALQTAVLAHPPCALAKRRDAGPAGQINRSHHPAALEEAHR
jgi:hypothetical protein